jgi:hypothetical protein
MQDLLGAYLAFRRGKGNTESVRAFDIHLEANLVDLLDDLVGGTYQPGRSICFPITRPKPREVWAAKTRDRVVHHLLYRRIGHAIERSFIADSSACIPGRGTLYAATRLHAKVRAVTQNGTRRAFYLKCDLANFFVSIDKQILHEELARQMRALHVGRWWLDLAATILFHDPRADVEMQGRPEDHARVPAHKSLRHQPAGKGLPIGNLPSQFGANVLLNVLDQHVKHRLKVRHYGRYVDDFYLLHESPRQLNAWRDAIEAFLPARLGLQLNPAKTILQPLDRGIDFVGQVIYPHHTTIRRRTFNDGLHRLATMPADEVYASANSYFGLCRQATHSHHDRARIANVVRMRGLAVNRQLRKAYA